MLQSQVTNIAATLPFSAFAPAKRAAKEAPGTMFKDTLKQSNKAMQKQVRQTPAEEESQAPVNGPEDERQENNLPSFPSTPPTQPDSDSPVKLTHSHMGHITQTIVSILERYPNNAPPNMKIVPLLEEYLKQLAQLEQALPQEVQELQSMLEEVLARMPQPESIGISPQAQDKLAQLVDLLRGYLYPLENVNDTAPEQKSEAAAAEIIPLRPLESFADKASARQTGGENDGQKEAKRPIGETPAQHIGVRIDIQPHKVLFAEGLTAQAAHHFMPQTAENLFETMIERIVALPDAEPHMEIALKPDHLGKLSIDLQLGQNGLTAKIIASDENVRNMLAANLNHLSESLAEKGIRVENVEIVYSQLADKPFDQRQPQQEHGASKDRNRFATQALWGAPETTSAWWEPAYDASAYTDEWGLGLSSVEYRA